LRITILVTNFVTLAIKKRISESRDSLDRGEQYPAALIHVHSGVTTSIRIPGMPAFSISSSTRVYIPSENDTGGEFGRSITCPAERYSATQLVITGLLHRMGLRKR